MNRFKLSRVWIDSNSREFESIHTCKGGNVNIHTLIPYSHWWHTMHWMLSESSTGLRHGWKRSQQPLPIKIRTQTRSKKKSWHGRSQILFSILITWRRSFEFGSKSAIPRDLLKKIQLFYDTNSRKLIDTTEEYPKGRNSCLVLNIFKRLHCQLVFWNIFDKELQTFRLHDLRIF